MLHCTNGLNQPAQTSKADTIAEELNGRDTARQNPNNGRKRQWWVTISPLPPVFFATYHVVFVVGAEGKLYKIYPPLRLSDQIMFTTSMQHFVPVPAPSLPPDSVVLDAIASTLPEPILETSPPPQTTRLNETYQSIFERNFLDLHPRNSAKKPAASKNNTIEKLADILISNPEDLNLALRTCESRPPDTQKDFVQAAANDEIPRVSGEMNLLETTPATDDPCKLLPFTSQDLVTFEDMATKMEEITTSDVPGDNPVQVTALSAVTPPTLENPELALIEPKLEPAPMFFMDQDEVISIGSDSEAETEPDEERVLKSRLKPDEGGAALVEQEDDELSDFFEHSITDETHEKIVREILEDKIQQQLSKDDDQLENQLRILTGESAMSPQTPANVAVITTFTAQTDTSQEQYVPSISKKLAALKSNFQPIVSMTDASGGASDSFSNFPGSSQSSTHEPNNGEVLSYLQRIENWLQSIQLQLDRLKDTSHQPKEDGYDSDSASRDDLLKFPLCKRTNLEMIDSMLKVCIAIATFHPIVEPTFIKFSKRVFRSLRNYNLEITDI